jgi:hypothetical protein
LRKAFKVIQTEWIYAAAFKEDVPADSIATGRCNCIYVFVWITEEEGVLHLLIITHINAFTPFMAIDSLLKLANSILAYVISTNKRSV